MQWIARLLSGLSGWFDWITQAAAALWHERANLEGSEAKEKEGLWEVFGSSATMRRALIEELVRQGIKHTPENIVAIAQDTNGRIVFLETGNARAGLKHIIDRHVADFAGRAIEEGQIADLVMAALTRGKPVGLQRIRPIYEVEFGGTTHYVAVEVGENGFVVGANPASLQHRLPDDADDG